jgi:hypothetical protein
MKDEEIHTIHLQNGMSGHTFHFYFKEDALNFALAANKMTDPREIHYFPPGVPTYNTDYGHLWTISYEGLIRLEKPKRTYQPEPEIVDNIGGIRIESIRKVWEREAQKPSECPGCPGWAVFNGDEVQRCDSCQRFDSDDAAWLHVAKLVASL